MLTFLVMILSALVLVLAGIVTFQQVQLRALKRSVRPAPVESGRSAAPEGDRERAAALCMDLKRVLTHIHTTAPAEIPGLSIERIRLLCADELKDKVNRISHTLQNGFSHALIRGMDRGELARLKEWTDRLSAAAREGKAIDDALSVVFNAWSANSTADLGDYAGRLAALSGRLDELDGSLQALLQGTSRRGDAALSVPERLRRAAGEASAPAVRDAMKALELLTERQYMALDRQTRARVENHYLQTLELVLTELGRAERAGEDADRREELCLRTIQVLSNVITAGQQSRRELDERGLEAEVTALERLAALRGDAGNGS